MRATQSAFPAKRGNEEGHGEGNARIGYAVFWLRLWWLSFLRAKPSRAANASGSPDVHFTLPVASCQFALVLCPAMTWPVCAAIYRKSVANATPTPHYAFPTPPILYPPLWLIGNQPKLVTIEIAFGQWIMIKNRWRHFMCIAESPCNCEKCGVTPSTAWGFANDNSLL